MFVRRLLAWGRQNRRDFPWRGETDPFKVLVAEVLLQRSRGSTVAKVYNELFSRWPDANSLAAAHESEIREVIRPAGLIRRATLLKRMAADVEAHGGVPRSVREMLRLSGVGRYAATATASIAFNTSRPSVDGTSARVYRRVFNLPQKGPEKVDEDLWNLVQEAAPRSRVGEWNWAVLDLAAAVCLPRLPICSNCPVLSACIYGSANLSIQDPARAP